MEVGSFSVGGFIEGLLGQMAGFFSLLKSEILNLKFLPPPV